MDGGTSTRPGQHSDLGACAQLIFGGVDRLRLRQAGARFRFGTFEYVSIAIRRVEQPAQLRPDWRWQLCRAGLLTHRNRPDYDDGNYHLSGNGLQLSLDNLIEMATLQGLEGENDTFTPIALTLGNCSAGTLNYTFTAPTVSQNNGTALTVTPLSGAILAARRPRPH